ncbi:TRAF-like protein [Tanacetum coccineum]
MFNGGVKILSLYMRCSMDESRCYCCTLDAQRRSQDAIVISYDGIVVHEMFNGGVEMLSRFEGAWIRGREEDSILTHRIAKAIPDTTEMGKSFNTAIRFTRCVATIYYVATRMNDSCLCFRCLPAIVNVSSISGKSEIALALSTIEGYPGYGVKQGENVVNVVVQDGSNFYRVFDMEGMCSMKEILDVVNHRHNNLTVRKDTLHQFHGRENDWGFASLYDHNKGYLVNYTCYFHLYVVVRHLAKMVILLAAGETDFVGL